MLIPCVHTYYDVHMMYIYEYVYVYLMYVFEYLQFLLKYLMFLSYQLEVEILKKKQIMFLILSRMWMFRYILGLSFS